MDEAVEMIALRFALIHERDKGISDAFNKGIQAAKYAIIHLLNAGDRYAAKGSIETMLRAFDKDPALMWAHSQYVQHRGNIDVVSRAVDGLLS